MAVHSCGYSLRSQLLQCCRACYRPYFSPQPPSCWSSLAAVRRGVLASKIEHQQSTCLECQTFVELFALIALMFHAVFEAVYSLSLYEAFARISPVYVTAIKRGGGLLLSSGAWCSRFQRALLNSQHSHGCVILCSAGVVVVRRVSQGQDGPDLVHGARRGADRVARVAFVLSNSAIDTQSETREETREETRGERRETERGETGLRQRILVVMVMLVQVLRAQVRPVTVTDERRCVWRLCACACACHVARYEASSVPCPTTPRPTRPSGEAAAS